MATARDQARMRSRRRSSAAAAALVAHAFFLTALLWQTRPTEVATLKPLDVQLIRMAAPTEVIKARPTVRPLPARKPVRPVSPDQQTVLVPIAPPPIAPQPIAPPQAAALPDLGKAVRAGVGCDLAGVVELSAEAQQQCRQRFVARERGPGNEYAAVGSAQRAFFDLKAKEALWWQQPFLATDPKNGCRPKVTNQQAAVAGGHGAISDWRVGMGCAVSF